MLYKICYVGSLDITLPEQKLHLCMRAIKSSSARISPSRGPFCQQGLTDIGQA